LAFSPAIIAQSNDTSQTQNNLEWPGVYQGFTPCGDCQGVKTSLAFNSNSSYVLITQNIGKSLREFVEKGKFTWDEKTKKITLIPRKGETTRYYLVGDNTLTQLDNIGNPMPSKQADRYVLRRTETSGKPPTHSMH
jgi:uncharacterized lipoprotein NlpE involved in copper resistance